MSKFMRYFRGILFVLVACLGLTVAAAADEMAADASQDALTATDSPLDSANYGKEDPNFREYYERNRYQPFGYWESLLGNPNKLAYVDFGLESYYFRYAEPDFMKEKGYFYGGFFNYTYRTQENDHVRSLRDAFTDSSKVNMFRVELRGAYGEVDYESEGTGTIDDIDDWTFEGRGIAGYDFPIGENGARFTPIFGVGYRYLHDSTGGRSSTTGALGYDRESNYVYFPVGLEFSCGAEQGWFLELSAEYDIFIWGKQKSHLEDVAAGFDTLENRQDEGYGYRGSVRLGFQTETIDFYVEPFYRYWDIEDSVVSGLTFSGALVGFGLEPANNTQEYGIKLGARF